MKKPSSPTSSPVTITVTASGGRRNSGLTSPIQRHSLSPLSGKSTRNSSARRRRYSISQQENDAVEGEDEEELNSEFVSYTVHIPPTPERPPFPSISDSQNSNLNGTATASTDRVEPGQGRLGLGFISGTIFTGGFNSVTRGHVIDCSMEKSQVQGKSCEECMMKGCDEKAIKNPCDCGFKICRECYLDCLSNKDGGHCPGCKELYDKDERENTGNEEKEEEEEEDEARPLPSMAEIKMDKRLSLVKSVKNPPDFDHNRWLFETKGTYGYGNAVWPKDGYGFGAGGGGGNNGFEYPPDFGERCRKPLTRKVAVSAAILSPYRYIFSF